MVFREHRHSVVTIRNSFFILTVLIIEETQLERTLSRFDLFYLCIDDGVRYRYGWGLGRVPVSLEASILTCKWLLVHSEGRTLLYNISSCGQFQSLHKCCLQ